MQWDVSDDFVLSARVDSGDQDAMRYFGIPNENGDFVRDFVGMNFNVSDSVVSYEDDSIRLKAEWQASDNFGLEAELYQLTSDRMWKNAEAYFLVGPDELERWDPLMIGHDMEHTGLRTNLSFSSSGDGVRASLGFEMNDVIVRPSHELPDAGQPDRHHLRRVRRRRPVTTSCPAFSRTSRRRRSCRTTSSDLSQWAVFGEAQFNLSDRLSIVGALRMDDYDTQVVRLGRAGIDQQVDDVTGRIGLVFDLSDDTALYGQYGTGSQHPSDSVVTGSVLNQEAEMIESEQVEIGLKHQVDGTGFAWTVALFDITKNNLIYDDPTSGDPADVIEVGEQTSQGIEVGFTYTASESFQFYGNASTLNSEIPGEGRPPFYIPSKRPTLASCGASATPFASSPTLATSATGSAAFRSRRTRSWTPPCASTLARASGSR